LEAKTRALAGLRGYTTNLVGQPALFVIDAYHQLWRIEKAFRMCADPSWPTDPHRRRPLSDDLAEALAKINRHDVH
jgi:hypothetical protein